MILLLASLLQLQVQENPEFKRWASFPVGAWVEMVQETEFVVDGKAEAGPKSRSKTRLAEIGADFLVLETATVDGGQQPTMKTKVFARIPPERGGGGAVTELDEEIEIAGKKIKCHRIEVRSPGSVDRRWWCDQIPGGLAKDESLMEMPGQARRFKRTVTAWEGVPGTPPKVPPVPSPAAEHWSDWFPLKAGARSIFAGKKGKVEVTLSWSFTAGKFKGSDCIVWDKEYLDHAGKKETRKIYLMLVDDGVKLLGAENQYVDPSEYLIRFPIRKGAPWQNFLIGPVEVQEKEEEVQAPAGKFPCKVLHWENSYPGMTFKTRWWLAKGIGVVRMTHEVVKDGKTTESDELLLKERTK